ncbi:MAG TPA: branched-chain amino acid ABC transporter substrate-binding protein [Candidatus Competibacteraceae bacterium]|nr:branched-chain amino acid ABC transporter substrate-binding protein [Candidatus Competibacteraceae bacterium]
MTRIPFKKTLWAAAIAGALGISGLANAAEVIKIGIAGPHTGAYAAFGEQLWKGSVQAAEDINAAGGINGKKIELVKADDACEPKQAVAVANRLVDNDKVVAVVGHFCSSSTIPASEIYAENDILSITPASTNPKVTDRGLKTVFRTCGRDDQQGVVAANYVIKVLKAKKVAVIHDKDTYGQGLADAMKAEMERLGVKPVLYEGLTRGEKDFNALVTKIKAAGADAVYFGGLHSEAGPLVRQMREQGLTATAFISGDGIVSEEFVSAAGGKQFVAGVYMTFGADATKLPDSKAVVEKFRKAGYEPEGYTLYSYAALQAIAEAIKGTGGQTSGTKLGDYLRSHEVKTVMGPKAWDAKGDLKVSDYVMWRWDENGKYAEIQVQ